MKIPFAWMFHKGRGPAGDRRRASTAGARHIPETFARARRRKGSNHGAHRASSQSALAPMELNAQVAHPCRHEHELRTTSLQHCTALGGDGYCHGGSELDTPCQQSTIRQAHGQIQRTPCRGRACGVQISPRRRAHTAPPGAWDRWRPPRTMSAAQPGRRTPVTAEAWVLRRRSHAPQLPTSRDPLPAPGRTGGAASQ